MKQFRKYQACSHVYPQQKNSKIKQLFLDAPNHPKTEKSSGINYQKSEERFSYLNVDRNNQKFITFNDMAEELAWLVDNFRMQAIFKICAVACLLSFVFIVFYSTPNAYKLLLSLFFYSFFKFVNIRQIIRVEAVRIWLKISQFASIYTLCNRIFLYMVNVINPESIISSKNLLIDYSLIPTMHCCILFLLIAKVSKKLYLPYIFPTIKENILNIFPSLKNMLSSLWNIKWILIQTQFILAGITFCILFVICNITNIIILNDIFKLTTVGIIFITFLFMMLIDYLLQILIQGPINRYCIQKTYFLESESNVPTLIQLLKIDPQIHERKNRKIRYQLIQQTYVRCLEWLVYQKIENIHINSPDFLIKAKESLTLRQFLQTKIRNSRFYNQYSDIVIKQFMNGYLKRFIKGNLEQFLEKERKMFIANKLNRASLMIDISYPIKMQYQQVLNYLTANKILYDFEIVSHMLQILAVLANQGTDSSKDQQMVTSQLLEYLENIWQKLDYTIYSLNYSTNIREKFVGMRNKLERVLKMYKNTHQQKRKDQ